MAIETFSTKVLKLLRVTEQVSTVYWVCPHCDEGFMVSQSSLNNSEGELTTHTCDKCGFEANVVNDEIYPQVVDSDKNTEGLFRIPKYDLFLGTILINNLGKQYVAGADGNLQLTLFPTDGSDPINPGQLLEDKTLGWKKYLPTKFLNGETTDLSSIYLMDPDGKRIINLSELTLIEEPEDAEYNKNVAPEASQPVITATTKNFSVPKPEPVPNNDSDYNDLGTWE